MGQVSSAGTRAFIQGVLAHPPLLGLGYLFPISTDQRQLRGDADERRPGFSATVYGLGGGLFFLTYALLEIPSGLMMPRIGARRWVARIMISWGLISAGMMFVRTPLQFYVMRLLLGAAEAGFWPTCIYYMANWFPPHTAAARSAASTASAESPAIVGRHAVGLAARVRRRGGPAGLAVAVPGRRIADGPAGHGDVLAASGFAGDRALAEG